MKKLAVCLAFFLLLCGCGMQETTYIVVEPHSEDYGTEIDSDTVTVGSYLSLRNAILSMVEDYTQEGVIRAESYSGNISEDISKAVSEVTSSTPLGTYAVASITYDYSRIVSYYEIHININYQRTQDEVASIIHIADTDALQEKLSGAMEAYSTRLLLMVDNYQSFDMEAAIQEIFLAHPEFALELPEVSVDLYPSVGTQRILDIRLTYTHTPEELAGYRDELADQIDRLANLYNKIPADMDRARRIYNRLGRNAVLELYSNQSLSGSAYSALVESSATTYGFAQAYRLLSEACGMPCQLVSGWKNGMVYYWCLAELDGESYYIDPSLMVTGQSVDYFLMGDLELSENGYYTGNSGSYPAVQLPDELRPPEETEEEVPEEETEEESETEFEVSEATFESEEGMESEERPESESEGNEIADNYAAAEPDTADHPAP